MNDTAVIEPTTSQEPDAPPERGSALKTVAWVLVALFFLTLFTFIKLPEDRVQEFVGAKISEALAPHGISLTSRAGKLGLGLSYTMLDARLSLPGASETIAFDEIKISPSFLSLIQAKLGADVSLKQGDGTLSLTGAGRGSSFSVSAKAKDFDIGKAGLLDYLAKIRGSAVVSGNADFSGDTSAFQNLSGKMDLALKKLVLDEQTLSLQGFPLNLPRLGVSEGAIAASAVNGKITLQTFKLGGKPGSADDLTGSLTGDLSLNRMMDQSNLNLRASFKLGEKVQKSFSFLESFMAPAKRADGSFVYDLKGPVAVLVPTPAGQ